MSAEDMWVSFFKMLHTDSINQIIQQNAKVEAITNSYVPREHLEFSKKVHVVTVKRKQLFKCGEATWINKLSPYLKDESNKKQKQNFFKNYMKKQILMSILERCRAEASTLKESIIFPEAFL